MDDSNIIETLSTEQFAATVGVLANSVRKQYCLFGHYMGIRPIKIRNRRLRWPVNEIAGLFDRQ